MSRSPRPGAPYGSAAHRERISQGLRRHYQRRRDAALVRPRELAAIRSTGTVPARLAPILDAAEAEVEALVEALGGVDALTPQRLALVQDVARVGLVMRAELARYVQRGDSDAAARVGSLAGQRRSSLALLGLERFERTLTLQDYLAARAASNGDAAEADAQDPEPGDRPTERDLERREPTP